MMIQKILTSNQKTAMNQSHIKNQRKGLLWAQRKKEFTLKKIEVHAISNREKAIQLLNDLPDYKMEYVVAYLQAVMLGVAEADTEMPENNKKEGRY